MSRLPHMFHSNAQAHRSPYPLGQFSGPAHTDYLMALLALSHTPVEDQLYRAMLSESSKLDGSSGAFSVKGLSGLTGINSFSTIRRALAGLHGKLSVESRRVDGPEERERIVYRIFKPEEIFERRLAAGLEPYPKEVAAFQKSLGFNPAIERVASNNNLSRREAQVALACAEGITNAEIARRLLVSEQTVKFHLRNIFTKFGVKRRTGLISRLLAQEDRALIE